AALPIEFRQARRLLELLAEARRRLPESGATPEQGLPDRISANSQSGPVAFRARAVGAPAAGVDRLQSRTSRAKGETGAHPRRYCADYRSLPRDRPSRTGGLPQAADRGAEGVHTHRASQRRTGKTGRRVSCTHTRIYPANVT